MTTYLHMKSGDVYEVDYLSIQPFLQHDQTDFASYTKCIRMLANLSSSVSYVSGTGTMEHPYIIK